MTCTSEWNPAPAVITWAVDGSQRCVSLLFFLLFKLPSLEKKKKPSDILEGRLHQQSGETHLTVPPPPPCPFVLLRRGGLLHLNLFSQQRPSVMGRKVLKFLKTFGFIRCEKPRLPSRPLPCSTSFHLHGSAFPWLLAAGPFCSAYSYCTDLFHQTLTWGYGCDHMLILLSFFRPHCAPMPPRSPLGCSCFTLALSIIIFSRFMEISRFFPNILIFELPNSLKM